jgi:hypothetical protein
VCCDREVWDGPHEAAFLVRSLELPIDVNDLFKGSEISDVHLAFMDPEVVRLEISVNVASGVNLSQSFQHFRGDICYYRVDILAPGNSLVNILLQGLLKELYDEIPSSVLLSVVIIVGEASEVFLLFVLLEVCALLEHTGVTGAVGVELDSAHLLRIHLHKQAHGSLAT